MCTFKTDWYFIVNPRAGSGKTMSEWMPAERRLRKLGISFVAELTTHKSHASELAFKAAGEGYRKIVAVGGDGTVHEVLGGICRWCDETGTLTSEFTVGVFPIGSGNDWIKSIGMPKDGGKIISAIAKGTTARMDVVKVQMADGKISYMANVGGTGFDSHVCERVNRQKEKGKRDKLIYLNGLIHTITHLKPIKIQVVADGKTVHEGPAYSVALGNGPYSGGGMCQVPMARLDDGILDYLVVPKLPLGYMLKEIPRLFRHNINEAEGLVSGRCKSLQIIPLDSKSADLVEVDGEVEGRLPLSITMEARQINIVKG